MLNFPIAGSVLLFLLTALLSLFSGDHTAPAPKPDESRFTPVVVVPGGELDEPNNFEVLKDGRVFISERRTGNVKMYDPETKSVKLIGTIAVNHTYTSASGQQREAEEGLVGMTIDPNFEQNHFMYLLFANPDTIKHTLARFEVRGDSLVTSSRKVVLEYHMQLEVCCHTGGGMTWDRQGNLYITVGNNTGNVIGSQTDQRLGRENWDDQRGASNSNDLRGKILRIHPEPDGSYTIPAGNLFPPGTPNTRPEIYTMGHRNAWRPSIDSRTGYLYWGEVGPDASAAAENTVEGYDEFNQARSPGYYGWPYFVGPNRAYPITDYATGKIGPPKDPAHPVNDSRNNTGIKQLPPARAAFISYPYAASEKYPEVGSGGRCAVGGPIYHRADRPDAVRPWPEYYEGKWIVADCARNWLMAITMDQNSDYQSMERFLPGYAPVEPLDLKFGPTGDLYVLEYGSTWFKQSPDTKLVRIEYNAGNRAPQVEVSANTTGGALPFRVSLSSAGTVDPDSDALKYQWSVVPAAGGAAQTFTTANPTVTLSRAGEYTATLTATDPSGAKTSRSIRLVAGNEPPAVAVDIRGGNRTFYFPGKPIDYAVRVTDREDAAVDPARVAFGIEYVPEGFDPKSLAQGDKPADASTRFAFAKSIIAGSDCSACHHVDTPRSVGPSFTEVAAKYQGDAGAVAHLVEKIHNGGSGVWGDVTMPAHPALSRTEVTAIVHYILSTNEKSFHALPLAGSYTPQLPEGDPGTGSVIVRAVYSDRGAAGLPSQTTERTVVLRSSKVGAGSADVIHDATTTTAGRGAGPVLAHPHANGYLAFRQLDLTGLHQATITAAASAQDGDTGGTIEIRLDSPTGELIGQAEVPAPGSAGAPRGRGGPARINADLKPVSGMHDLYLVFRNGQARPFQPLMSFGSIEFEP